MAWYGKEAGETRRNEEVVLVGSVGTIGADDGTGIAARLNPTTRSEGVKAPLSWEEEKEDEADEADEADEEDVGGA